MSVNQVTPHEKHGDIVGVACEDLNTSSELCSILDGYEIAPTDSGNGFREAFENTEIFSDEVVSVTITNTSLDSRSYSVTLSNEIFVSPATTFKALASGAVSAGGSEAFSLTNLNNPAGNSNFILFMKDLDEFAAIDNVTFAFSCS